MTERVPYDTWLPDPIARWRELAVAQVFIAERSPFHGPEHQVLQRFRSPYGHAELPARDEAPSYLSFRGRRPFQLFRSCPLRRKGVESRQL